MEEERRGENARVEIRWPYWRVNAGGNSEGGHTEVKVAAIAVAEG